MLTQDWILQVWGVRGSMPAAYQEFLEYGGNTSCISVDCGGDLAVFDAGSGLTALGRAITRRRPIHIFISHLHADHLMGLFVFQPFFDPGAEIHLYGEALDGVSFRQRLETFLGYPYWPVSFPEYHASVTFHEIAPGQTVPLPGGRTVSTLRGNHPGQCLLYRLDGPGRSVVHALDCELTEELRPALTAFCRDADVLVWDGCFTDEDLARHPGWGHSSWRQGAEVGRDAGARLTLMTHYNQTYTDDFLRQQERLAEQTGVLFARERMELHI